MLAPHMLAPPLAGAQMIGPWQQKADANVPRSEATSAVIDGQLYVFSGFTNSSLDVDGSVEVYDPRADTWTLKEHPMPTPVTHAVPAVVEGRVWFAGGFTTQNNSVVATVQVYDPSTDTWETSADEGTPIPPLPEKRTSGGLVYVGGLLHYFGGLQADGQTNAGSHWTLDPANPDAGWQPRADMNRPRDHISVVAAQGQIYVIGGSTNFSDDTALMDVYDPEADAWTALPDLPLVRSHSEPSTFVYDGKIIVAGGETSGNNTIESVHAYDLSTETWNTGLRDLPADLLGPAARIIEVEGQDLFVLTHGGDGGATHPQKATYTAEVTRADKPGTWMTVADFGETRHETSFVEVGGSFYLLGGRESRAARIYDPEAETWTEGAAAPTVLHHFEAVALDGLIYAGMAFADNDFPHETPAEHLYVYDPAADTWTAGPQIPAGRRRGAAGAFVREGKVYFVGGLTNGHSSGHVAWFDAYDPATDTWTQLADAPRARDHFFATYHEEEDKLYLVGGRTSGDPSLFAGTIAEVDVYDFDTGGWSTLPAAENLPTPRAAAPTALLDGEIIVAGGESATQESAHAETEAFDLEKQTWRSLADMKTPRHGTQAIVSGSGFYVAAGSPMRGSPQGAELPLEVFSLSGDPNGEEVEGLVVNEFLADPAGLDANEDGTADDAEDEFVEVFNGTAGAVNLGSYQLASEAGDAYTFPEGVTLAAGRGAVVFGGGASARSPAAFVDTGLPGLENTGGTIYLINAAGDTIDTARFADGEAAGVSLARNPNGTGPFEPQNTFGTMSSETAGQHNGDGGDLPVEFAGAPTPAVDGRSVTLTWTTLTEASNLGFYVERRRDGESEWASSERIEGAGTSTDENTYRYTVDGLRSGSYTFRIRQVDRDGAESLSQRARATIEATGFALEAPVPNPVRAGGTATLRFSIGADGNRSAEDDVQARLYDSLGRRVRRLDPSGARIHVKAGGLASGVYVVHLKAGGRVATQTIIIVR